VEVNIYLCCFEELGVIYPMISNPHCSKGLETVTGWSGIVALFSLLDAYLISFTVPRVGVSVFEQGGPIIAVRARIVAG
jgi:hypothetical protein